MLGASPYEIACSFPRAQADRSLKRVVNDRLLNRSNDQLVAAFKEALAVAKEQSIFREARTDPGKQSSSCT